MREEVRIIVLSIEEFAWLKMMLELGHVGPKGDLYRTMEDDYMCENLEMALKAHKKAYINEMAEVTITIRLM